MRVGLVCPYSWDVPGGVRSHVADLAVALQDHGHDISVLAPVEDPADLPPWRSSTMLKPYERAR